MASTSGVKFSALPMKDIAGTPNEDDSYEDNPETAGYLRDSSNDELCGLGSWRPTWLQKLANHRTYAVAFVFVGVVQGMIYTYFNGVITTVEKAFAIPSSTMGLILSGNDLSQIICGVFVTYLASKGSRPFWLAIGMCLTSLSCFLYATAQLFYDPQVYQTFENQSVPKAPEHHHVMCSVDSHLNATMDLATNPEICGTRPSSVSAIIIFFLGQFISGIGSMALFTLGFTYMDDSVKRSSFPLYMTFTSALRSLGPTIGFGLASACLKIYIHPSETPEYYQNDVRWLGAWWLGFIIVGISQLLISFPISLFPKQLPNTSGKRQSIIKEPEKQHKVPRLKEFIVTIRRMGNNPVIVFQMICTGPIILGVIGFATFMPKYLEAQFGQTSSQASIFTGASSMLMMMIGSIGGGLLVWKYQPSALCICIWGAIADIVYALGIFTIMSFKCDSVDFFGVTFENGGLEVTSSCSQDCGCDNTFDPICIGDSNYLSPCLAGCSTVYKENQTTVFLNCMCSADLSNGSFLTMGKTGYCPGSKGNCGYFWPYIIILAIMKFIASSTRIGGMIVLIRSVDKRDRAIGMALWGAIASLFGFIPGPIIYGAVVDSTCLLWGKQPCGQKGNCWLYDLDSLRYWYHGITIACFIIAAGCDVLTALFTRELKLYDDDESEKSRGRVLSYKEGFSCFISSGLSASSSTHVNPHYDRVNSME